MTMEREKLANVKEFFDQSWDFTNFARVIFFGGPTLRNLAKVLFHKMLEMRKWSREMVMQNWQMFIKKVMDIFFKSTAMKGEMVGPVGSIQDSSVSGLGSIPKSACWTLSCCRSHPHRISL